ncbi:MAG TPA: alpha/beta hydrolase [Paenirhodobacter sp.]
MPKDIHHGIETQWQQLGAGDRPALAIHCMLGSSEIWTPVLTPLADRITATTFDLPGHGQSGVWVNDGTAGGYQTLSTRIAAGFIDRPVDLIGHSFGALIALRIAVGAPQAVRSLTLIEPVLFAAVAGSPAWLDWRTRQDRLEALLATGRHGEAARDFMADWGTGLPWDALPERQRNRFTAQMPMIDSVTQSNFTDPGQIWRPDGIEAIDVPVLLIHGANSPPICAEICTAIADRVADVGVASVPGAGHMLPLTHARQVSDLIAVNLERS